VVGVYRVRVGETDDLDRRYAWGVAEQIRLHRAWLLGEVAAGSLSLDGLLAEQETSQWQATVKVVVVAEKVPGVGKVRARRAMESVGIAEDARWGEVDPDRLRRLWAAMEAAALLPILS